MAWQIANSAAITAKLSNENKTVTVAGIKPTFFQDTEEDCVDNINLLLAIGGKEVVNDQNLKGKLDYEGSGD